MKRSDMKRLIENIISSMCVISTPSYSLDDVSETILCAVEEAGLKPPKTVLCPVLLTKKHVWEKEEE